MCSGVPQIAKSRLGKGYRRPGYVKLYQNLPRVTDSKPWQLVNALPERLCARRLGSSPLHALFWPNLTTQSPRRPMLVASLLLLPLLQDTGPPPTVEVAAWLEADELTVGGNYSIQIELGLPEGVDIEAGGLPEALLQIDCPASIKLAGPYFDTLALQARNEHLMMPYERQFKGTRVAVEFELLSAPAAGDSIGLIVVGYADPGKEAAEDVNPFFFRRRFELTLAPNAEATHGDDENSNWGRDETLLQIGSKVGDVTVPNLEGGELALGSMLGKSNLLVSTYRAHW
ncbi:MAG: hypothetical protein ACI8PQ_000526 [Planctomycetota bacterium]